MLSKFILFLFLITLSITAFSGIVIVDNESHEGANLSTPIDPEAKYLTGHLYSFDEKNVEVIQGKIIFKVPHKLVLTNHKNVVGSSVVIKLASSQEIISSRKKRP